MSCYRPLKAYRAPGSKSESGSRPVTFQRRAGYVDREVEIPCGRCTGCRLDRARQWAIRCVHEAQLHDSNLYVTLTYRPGAEPPGGSLDKTHFPGFMKRLRSWHFHAWRKLNPDKPREECPPIRYFHCGEYGDELWRPHYHAILFGVHFGDHELLKRQRHGDLYRSPTLDRLWGHGFASIGAVTYQSAGYVARYCMKKVLGDLADEHYRRVDKTTGEVVQLEPEYATMSLKPGIGARWFHEFDRDCYPSDFVTMGGSIKGKPPKYYERLLKREQPGRLQEVKDARERRARDPEQLQHNTPRRRAVREEVKLAQISLKKRNVE